MVLVNLRAYLGGINGFIGGGKDEGSMILEVIVQYVIVY